MSFVQTKQQLVGGGAAIGNSKSLYKTNSSIQIKEQQLDSKIPIVRHVIKDQQVEQPEGEQFEPLELDKIIKLFVDPHSASLIDRHLHCIKKINKHYKRGFLMKDVVKIVKLLNILAEMMDTQKEAAESYRESMCTLLTLFQFPFMKEKSSDELVFEQLIAECVSNLGYLFRVGDGRVRDHILACILNLVTYDLVPETYCNLKRCSRQFLHKCIKLSDLPETLVKSLTLIDDDVSLRVKTIKILQLLSKDKINCEKLLDAECAHRIVLKMNSTSSFQASEELLFRSTETLWNLLENGDQRRVAEQMNSLITLSQLRDAFLQQLLQGYSNYDRQLRNDILIISIQLASIMPRLPFIECGMAKDLLLFATYPEVKTHNPLCRNLKLTTCYEDFELKKLFFIFAAAISKNTTAYQLLSESGILLALLSFIKPVEQDREAAARDWTKSQFEELQLHAMSTLCQLIPVMLKDYFQCRGSNRLLVFLEWCSNDKNDYIGNGNNFFGSGGRGTKKSQLKYCLRVLRSVVNTSNEQAIQDLTDQDALTTLTRIIKNYSATESRTCCDQLDMEIQCDVMFVISCICENDLHRKELFGTDGTSVLLQLMKKRPEEIWNGLGYQRFIIAVVDCIWSTIVGSIVNEDYFIQSEGIFNLLDILEVSPKSIQNIILGCVLDLCDNPKTLIHMLQWESNENAKIAHFLCQLWRIEERDMGVQRDSNGIITNPGKPLASAADIAEENNTSGGLGSHLPSRSIVEVSENMRGKIYGIFCKLGFNDLSGISNEDQLTLCIIENYLDFKLGEVFGEISSELQAEGIEPIPPDQEALDTILRAAEDRAVHVNMNQKYLHNTFMQQEIMQEKEFYYEIKKNFGFKEEKMQEWRAYVARTSKYNVLVSHKNKQMAAIEDSRPPERDPVPYETIHNLEIPNLAVTAFAGPYIAIDSTPAEITGGRLKKMILR